MVRSAPGERELEPWTTPAPPPSSPRRAPGGPRARGSPATRSRTSAACAAASPTGTSPASPAASPATSTSTRSSCASRWSSRSSSAVPACWLYVAAWLLVPEEGTADEPLGLDQRNRTIALVGVGVLALLARASATGPAPSGSRGRSRSSLPSSCGSSTASKESRRRVRPMAAPRPPAHRRTTLRAASSHRGPPTPADATDAYDPPTRPARPTPRRPVRTVRPRHVGRATRASADRSCSCSRSR